jgi:hypothetical protein
MKEINYRPQRISPQEFYNRFIKRFLDLENEIISKVGYMTQIKDITNNRFSQEFRIRMFNFPYNRSEKVVSGNLSNDLTTRFDITPYTTTMQYSKNQTIKKGSVVILGEIARNRKTLKEILEEIGRNKLIKID